VVRVHPLGTWSLMVEQWTEVSFGIALWYLTSFGTLLLNKYLLGALGVRPGTLALVQMVSTAVYGAFKNVGLGDLHRGVREVLSSDAKGGGSTDLEDPGDGSRKGHAQGWRRSLAQLGLVGAMRFATVVLGLVSLKNIAASFTETIKASAPFFTVIVAYLMLGERTTLRVLVSLVPVASGLVMVSCSELSFNAVGFSAAVATNVIECMQNVFSKRLLTREYTASQLQFYTSLTALVLQVPLLAFGPAEAASPHAMQTGNVTAIVMDAPGTHGNLTADGQLVDRLAGQPSLALSRRALMLLWVDGVLYHLQSVVAYVVMSYLSPVTVSVVNTLKRALLIWISVLVFGNPVTPLARAGTAVCLLGALWYNVARHPPQPRAK